MPYPKRDIVKSPISFGFHGKLGALGNFFLAESYQTKFNATFFILVSTDVSKHSKVSFMNFKFLTTEMDKQPLRHILNSQPSSEHRVSSKVLSIEGYYSINIFSLYWKEQFIFLEPIE